MVRSRKLTSSAPKDKALIVAFTGGGSGGHITPILAIAREMKDRQPKNRLVYIGQKGDKLGDLLAQETAIDKVYRVRAGKFRRYHGEGWRQFTDASTMLKNLRDGGYVLIGLYQSWRILRSLRPDVLFIKGGFVGVPVGLAAALLQIPYVTHDSDAIPGLANRIIARWAKVHAVALPVSNYPYPPDQTQTTGIPVRQAFVPVDDARQRSYRKATKLPDQAQIIFVIGGGLGSQTINQAVQRAAPHLLREFPGLHLVQVTGRHNYGAARHFYENHVGTTEQGRVQLFDYLNDVHLWSGAADVIITRAGATNLAEFALQGKACLVVPSPFLAGGHQLRNAEVLARAGAVEIINDDELSRDSNRLITVLGQLLRDRSRRQSLAAALAKFSQPRAAVELADLILSVARGSS